MRASQVLLALGLTAPLATCIQLTVSAPQSLRDASATLAFDVLSPYVANASGTPPYVVGTFPQPLYWWHAGAVWGAMLDHWAYTGDTTYNPSVTQALLAQIGPNADLMPPQYRASMGNDDISFWAFAALAALEYGLPFPTDSTKPANLDSWLQLAQRVFDGMVSRWDMTSCGGGLKWQVPPENAGYDYKNSISNGGFFQIAARLARYTGNSTYSDWANKIWDWTNATKLIDSESFTVYDGADDKLDCREADHTAWTYNAAVFLGGAAYMYNATGGDALWGDRALALLARAEYVFFTPFDNSTNVLYEYACELLPRRSGSESDTEGGCNNDQLTFKGYLGRWMGKAAVLAPFLADRIRPLLATSANGAAVACSGYVPGAATSVLPGLGLNGTLCSQHFFASVDNINQLSSTGYFGALTMAQKVGHHLSALEVIQANIPFVDTRSEEQGGPRRIRTDIGVKVEQAPSTTAVVPRSVATSTSLVKTVAQKPNTGTRLGPAMEIGLSSALALSAALLAL